MENFFGIQKEQVARQYGRWVVLSWILAMRIICIPLRKKYPTLKSIEDEGASPSLSRISWREVNQCNGIYTTI